MRACGIFKKVIFCPVFLARPGNPGPDYHPDSSLALPESDHADYRFIFNSELFRTVLSKLRECHTIRFLREL
jgi:hypothetical protein